MKKILLFMIGLALVCSCDSSNDAGLAPSASGTGGSLARFSIVGNTLYVVGDVDLTTFDIAEPSKLNEVNKANVGVGIETIFGYKGHLFIGSETAMYIYNLDNPHEPMRLSVYEHVTSCDPVVVQGDYAYVSLRSSSNCRFQGEDLLDIVDVSDLSNPKRLSSTSVFNPYGLGVKGDKLYLCRGEYGLSIMDISDPQSPETESELEVDSFDVIVNGNVLIITGADGIYQYDISNPEQMQLISKIEVEV